MAPFLYRFTPMRQFSNGALALLFCAGCPSQDTTGLQPVCETIGARPPDGTHAIETLERGTWRYRRSIVTEGAFDGMSVDAVVTLTVESDAVVAHDGPVEVARWPITATPESDGCNVSGPAVQVEWWRTSPAFAIGPERWAGTFTASAEREDHRITAHDYVEVLETGTVTFDALACAELIGLAAGAAPCEATVEVRHSLAPSPPLIPARRANPTDVGMVTIGGLLARAPLERGPVVLYLPPGSGAVHEIADRVQGEIAAVVGPLSIAPNACSAERIEAALAEEPADGPLHRIDTSDLALACTTLERHDPTFVWQRPGDVRFWTIEIDQRAPWGLHVRRFVDRSSGEISSARIILGSDRTRRALAALDAALQGGLRPVAHHVRSDLRRTMLATTLAPDALVDAVRTRVETAERFTYAAQRETYETLVEDLRQDDHFARFWMDQPAIERYDRLPERLDLFRDVQSRAGVLAAEGYDFGPLDHAEKLSRLAPELAAMPPEAAADLARRSLLTHTLLHGIGHALGLTDSFAASARVPIASVMDHLPADVQATTLELGAEDRAALAYLYGGASLPARTVCERPGLALDCDAGDIGTTAAEIFAEKRTWLEVGYPFGRETDDPVYDLLPALDVLTYASRTAAFLPNVVDDGDQLRDLVTVVAGGANAAHAMLMAPDYGPSCIAWRTDGQPVVYLPHYFFRSDCNDTEFDIFVPPGDGRPIVVTNFEITSRLGAHDTLDRRHALLLLGLAPPDARDAPTVLSLLPEPVYTLIDNSVGHEFFLVEQHAIAAGGSWCGDHVVPRELVPFGPAPDCPGLVYPRLSNAPNRTSDAVVVAFAFAPPSVQAALEVYRVGEDDGAIDWAAYDPSELCSFEALDGTRYRAIRADAPIGCRLLELAEERRLDYNITMSPFTRDAYEAVLRQVELIGAMRDRFGD